MVGIFDCGGVLGKYEIRLKERKVVNMEALNTYKTEKTLAEQMNERLAEMKMTKAEAALKPWKAFPVSKERYRKCEDRNLGNEYSLPCFPYNVGDSRNSGSSSRLCSPME